MNDRTGHADFDPRKIANMLDLSLAELARLVGVSRSALSRVPLGTNTMARLTPLGQILEQASGMSGNATGAMIWFKYRPIISMGTKTAMEHVADGHAAFVLQHLEAVRNGVYA